MNRESYITREASLEERKKVWKNQRTSAETHIALGQTLQQQGVEILNALQEQEIEWKEQLKLYDADIQKELEPIRKKLFKPVKKVHVLLSIPLDHYHEITKVIEKLGENEHIEILQKMNSTAYTQSFSCEEEGTLKFQSSDKSPAIYTGEHLASTDAIYPLTQSEPNGNWISEERRQVTFQYDSSVSVFDVAAYILEKMGSMTTMKLQKLVYYCQAWSLVWDEKPLYTESIEAWANGPVIRELFNYHRGQYTISSVLIGNPDILTPEQEETIDAVLDYYGGKSSQWLIDLTHMETPWRIARAGVPKMERGNRVVDLDVIADYYSSLPPEE